VGPRPDPVQGPGQGSFRGARPGDRSGGRLRGARRLKIEPRFSLRLSLERLKAAGLEPRTIFDVGVATGTAGLYDVFEDVRYVLIEPLAESAPFMRKVLQAHPGSVAVSAAAGRAMGEASLTVTPNLSGSSFLVKTGDAERRTVPMVTLDHVAAEHAPPAPYLLKLDVQGYELEALAGGEAVLKDACAVVAEVSLWADRKRRGIAEFAELVGWMRERGFVLYDIAQIVRRDVDAAITEMDLVFLPSDSPLRQQTTYKLPELDKSVTEQRRRDFGLT
jgi:FkbM family methyltransferase